MKFVELLVLLFLMICLYICESVVVRNKRDLKSDLISDALFLASKARNEITLLLKQNRSADAKRIEKYEIEMNDLVDKLRVETNETVIEKLIDALTYAEGIIIIYFRRVDAPDFEELKKSLISYGEEVVAKANQEIIKLTQQNTTTDAETIENDVIAINVSLNNIKLSTLTYNAFVAELKLTLDMTQLQQDLLNSNISLNYGNSRYQLIDRSRNLEVDFNKLKTLALDESLKSEIIVRLDNDFKTIAELAVYMVLSTDKVEIDVSAFNLTQSIFRIEAILAVLRIQTISGEERITLLYEIEDLASKAAILAEKLIKINMTSAADEFVAQNQLLINLNTAVRNAVNPLDLISLEYKFKGISERLSELTKVYGNN